MVYSVYQFNQYLINKRLLSTEQIADVLREAQEKKYSLVLCLIENKLLDGKSIFEALLDCFQIETLALENYVVQNSPTLLNTKFITQHHILPIELVDTQLTIAVADPTQAALFTEIGFRTGFQVKPILMDYEELHRAITQYLNYQQRELTPLQKMDINDDSAIIHYVEQILQEAVRQRASDIHFEPYETDFRIRLRIDGILHTLANPPLNIISRLTTRLKVMARLDIAERRLPQDGRFNFTATKQTVFDCRVSTCPTLFGEKIVVRILDAASPTLSVEQLGMETEQQKIYLNALKRPQGLILVTGPTGSGKTMTLYSALNLLNTLEKNISTVEDPVEIKLAGINQVNVNPKAGFTFANALRAFLRQDPDIIMVGEIRDLETAEIALKAAQTGHLVLSTVHTNNAMATIARLANMGIPLYQITGAISLIVAQRLVRKLCNQCKQCIDDEYQANHEGCRQCTRGYHGRIGVFELLAITETARESLNNFHDQTSYENLYRSGLSKVAAGITTLSEIQRVIDN